jgi:hypothetical protein
MYRAGVNFTDRHSTFSGFAEQRATSAIASISNYASELEREEPPEAMKLYHHPV